MNKIISYIALAVLCFAAFSSMSGQKRIVEKSQEIAIPNSTEIGKVSALSDGNGVWISWQMKAENNNLGFNIYRKSLEKSELATSNLIGGSFLKSGEELVFGQTYSYYDPYGSIESSYTIEALAVNGQRSLSGIVYVDFVDSLLGPAGRTSQELKTQFQSESFRVERSTPMLSKELELDIVTNALPPNLNTQRFVASQPGVKLGTKKEGIYRVSRTELMTAGFNLNLPHENWQLYMNGNEQSIIVADEGNFIEFYGQGIDTIESGTQIYYLINGSAPGKRIANSVRRRFAGTVTANSYEQSFYRADRLNYLNQVRNGEANNFFGQVVSTTASDVNFELTGIDQTSATSTLTIKLQGLTLTPHNVDVSINGVIQTPISGINHESMTRTYQIPTSILIEGTNQITLRVPSSGSDISLVDSVRVNYSRHYLAVQNSLSFAAKPNKQFEIQNFTSGQVRVFDTSFSDSPTLITNLVQTESNGLTSITIPGNRPRKMFAVADNAVLSVDSISQNTASTLATSNHNANYLIITHKNWIAESQAWADYRASQGFSVEMVRIDDIFDEFNYGITNSVSIREFLQFAVSNWNTPPNYILIIGDASFDPRGFSGTPDSNFVPTKMFDTAYEETGSDDALSDFDNDGLSEIAIGRIPAKLPRDVSQILGKVIIFERTSDTAIDRGALFASDLPNGYDFAGMSQRLANELPVGTPKTMINRGDANARVNLLASLDSGKYLVNYSGHGASGLWASTSFYSFDDVININNGSDYSVFTLLTCLNGYFINPYADSLSEALLKAPNGGSVAVWASSGKTTPDVQEVLARRFYQKIAAGQITRMGDLIKDAKQNVIGGRDVRLSWTLLGDPALKVR